MNPYIRPANLAVKVGSLCLFGVIAMALVGSSMRVDREYKAVPPRDLPGEVIAVIRGRSPFCKDVIPCLNRLQAEGYPLRIVDLDTNPDFQVTPPVREIPAYLLYHEGIEIRRRNGAMPESEIRRLWLPAYRNAAAKE